MDRGFPFMSDEESARMDSDNDYKRIQALEQRIANAIDLIDRIPEDVQDPHNWFHAVKLELKGEDDG